jgi:GNAT superfamily N-acetyltransferase
VLQSFAACKKSSINRSVGAKGQLMEKVVSVEGLRRATAADRADIEALQAEAYAENAVITGQMPIPLAWDYGKVLDEWDVWLSEDNLGLTGVLILHLRPDDLYIESIAVADRARKTGLGGRMMRAAEIAAMAAGHSLMRLLTNEKNVDRIAVYAHYGYVVEFIEETPARRIVHMVKHLTQV